MKNNTNSFQPKKNKPSWIRKIAVMLISFTFLAANLLANPPLATKQQIGMFLNSKTCVVLEPGNIAYSTNIKDAVQKYWNSTSFEFIDAPEFEKRRFDSKYSFLVLTKGTFSGDPAGVSYSYMRLVLGSTQSEITNMPEFCSVPLSYTDDNNGDFEFAIPSIVKFMQKHILVLQNKHFLLKLNGLSYYNNMRNFKDKVLLLNKEKMAPNSDSPEKILTVYPYYIKLLTSSEIAKQLSSSPVNTLFDFHIGPPKNSAAGKCFDMIFDVEGNLYYYHERAITNENADGFNQDNFRNIR